MLSLLLPISSTVVIFSFEKILSVGVGSVGIFCGDDEIGFVERARPLSLKHGGGELESCAYCMADNQVAIDGTCRTYSSGQYQQRAGDAA